jgi:imidazolonepropionase-like amidohydrolase
MGVIPGFTIHAELGILTSNGLTPYEAIQTGTVNASAAIEAMTGTNDFGTIEIGKRADLLLIGGNPLEDITHIEAQLRGVMAAGTWYPQTELNEIILFDP